jgi:hypothetical protein
MKQSPSRAGELAVFANIFVRKSLTLTASHYFRLPAARAFESDKILPTQNIYPAAAAFQYFICHYTTKDYLTW